MVCCLSGNKGSLSPYVQSVVSRLQNEACLIGRVLNQRAGFVANRLRNVAGTVPLLSLPTHEHRWIDHSEFINRIQQYIATDIKWNKADLRAALLRLPPDTPIKPKAQFKSRLEDERNKTQEVDHQGSPQRNQCSSAFEQQSATVG